MWLKLLLFPSLLFDLHACMSIICQWRRLWAVMVLWSVAHSAVTLFSRTDASPKLFKSGSGAQKPAWKGRQAIRHHCWCISVERTWWNGEWHSVIFFCFFTCFAGHCLHKLQCLKHNLLQSCHFACMNTPNWNLRSGQFCWRNPLLPQLFLNECF